MRGGARAGLLATAGVATNETVHITLAAAGLSAFFGAAPTAFTALRLAGAGYLVHLGVQAIRHRGEAQVEQEGASGVTGRRAYLAVLGFHFHPGPAGQLARGREPVHVAEAWHQVVPLLVQLDADAIERLQRRWDRRPTGELGQAFEALAANVLAVRERLLDPQVVAWSLVGAVTAGQLVAPASG